MEIAADVPLIWTIHGNLPVSTLVKSVEWDVQEGYIKLTETYKRGDEIVRQSVHVYDKRGFGAQSSAANF